MGNRAYIQIDSERLQDSILFYGHWSGDDNLIAVRTALMLTDRIGDATYLSAQIFYQFTKLANYDGGLGFGIDVGTMATDFGDVPTVYVNADTGVYEYQGVAYEEFAVQKV